MQVRRRVEPPRSILILKPSSFGDIIHTLPAVAMLRAQWPSCRISWLANTEWCPLLDGSPLVDRVVPFPRKQFSGWRGLRTLPRWLQTSFVVEPYDLVLDYQGLLRTALLGRYARGKKFLGLADAREGAAWLYDEAIPVPQGVPHAVERYLALSLHVTGRGNTARPTAEYDEDIRFPLPEGEAIEQAEMLHERFVLLHPFARGRDKSLSVEQVQALCACIYPRQVVLVGGAPVANMPLSSHCLNLMNRTTLPQLLWLTRRAGFVISVDSGPAHLAAALAKPMVAIHTWSDPRRVGSYLPTAWILKNGELLRFQEFRTMENSFFERTSKKISASEISAICQLITSS